LKNKLFALLLMSTALFAQELPEEPDAALNATNSISYGFYSTGVRYGEASSDSLFIRWAHTAEADTFWVYKGNLSLEYITNANTRTVFYNQPMRYERRMATHHLRERIFDSSFRFSELEALAKRRNSRLTQFFFAR